MTQTEPTGIEHYIVPKFQRDKFNAILKHVYDVFTEHNIEFFLMRSNLLGAMRDGYPVPWSDDSDIGVFTKDVNKITALKDVLEKNHTFEFEAFGNLKVFKLTDLTSTVIFNEDRTVCLAQPTLDFFIFEKDETGKFFHLWGENMRKKFTHDKFKVEKLLPFRKVPFKICDEEILFNIPNKAEEYLENKYPEWNTHFYIKIRDTNQFEFIKTKTKTYLLKEFFPQF